MNRDYWYVGQEVSEQRYGNGVITEIKSDSNYPIFVNFKHVGFITFTEEGKENIDDQFPSLSPNPHVPIKYNKIFKKGEVVKYKKGGTWYLGIYDRFVENKHLVSEGFNDEKLESVFDADYIENENILKF